MDKDQEQTGASLEDLPLPDDLPEPHTEDRSELNEGKEEGASQSMKCSPDLLRMLKAAESRRAALSRDREEAQASQPETEEPVIEALKTDMVSEDVAAFPHFDL